MSTTKSRRSGGRSRVWWWAFWGAVLMTLWQFEVPPDGAGSDTYLAGYVVGRLVGTVFFGGLFGAGAGALLGVGGGPSVASPPARILAAGALVWRDEQQRELCLVHRHRYDDWCLPKGKLDPDERFLAAVVRETEEETGYPVRLGEFAGELFYEVKGQPKTVLFWHCYVTREEPVARPDPTEVESVEWVSVEEACERLSYDDERGLLSRSAAPPALPGSSASPSA